MRLPTLFHLVIASCVSVFLACGASDELRDSSDELPDDFILSDDVAQIAGLPYGVGVYPYMFGPPGLRLPVLRRINPAAQANWMFKNLLIKHDGELRLSLELRYRSFIPDQMQLTFVGSVVFLHLTGLYPYRGKIRTRQRTEMLTLLFSPIAIDQRDVQHAIVTYKGNFELPDVNIFEGRSLEHLGLGFAWLRVYQTPQGEHLYELMLSSEPFSRDENFKVDTSYQNVSGNFPSIYFPFHESQMGVAGVEHIWNKHDLNETDSFTDFFDYVAWVQENLLVPKNTPGIWIPYTLEDTTDVLIKIYRVDGQLVRQLNISYQAQDRYLGSQAAYFDGKDGHGKPLANGAYFYQIKIGDFVTTRRMVLTK